MSEGYNTPKIGRSGPTSPAASEKTTSSRAVLAALRALQDKIARLEGERAEAVHSTHELRAQGLRRDFCGLRRRRGCG